MKVLPNSVDSFETLVSKFKTRFTTDQPHHLTSIALVSIRQEKGESIRKLTDRFGKVATSIQNLSQDVAIHHMIMSLLSGPFADNLCMQPAANLEEIGRRVAKFMQLKKLKEFRNQARAKASGGKGKEECHNQRTAGRGDRCKDNRGHRFTRYTP